MKKIYSLGVALFLLQTILPAQEAKPELLKEPGNWVFERFPLPPQFAPQIKYNGVEEIRFSPGMFKKDSADYFSYAFVAWIDSLHEIGPDEIHSYLFYYYRGICITIANEKKHPIDSTLIAVVVDPRPASAADGLIYKAKVDVIGVFDDWAPVKLNMEIKVMKDPARKKSYLIFLASPQAFGTGIWEKLYKIRAQVKIE